MGVVSAQQQASAQAAAYNQQAQIADNNAKAATRQAESTMVAGAQEGQLRLRQAKSVEGGQIAAYGANNLDISTGSPSAILQDTERYGQLDKSNTEYNAATNTWSLKSQATDYTNQASADRSSAANAKTAGTMNSIAALLNGGSTLAGQYSGFQQSGAIVPKVKKTTL